MPEVYPLADHDLDSNQIQGLLPLRPIVSRSPHRWDNPNQLPSKTLGLPSAWSNHQIGPGSPPTNTTDCHAGNTSNLSQSGHVFHVGSESEDLDSLCSLLLASFSESQGLVFQKTWSPPIPRSEVRSDSAFILPDGRCILLSADHATMYDFKFDSQQYVTYRIEGPRPEMQAGSSLAICNTKIFLFGGLSNSSETRSNDLWTLDVKHASGSPLAWNLYEPRPYAAIPPPRTGHTCVPSGERLYLFGGFDGDRRMNDVWVFDVPTGVWGRVDCVGYQPEPRALHSAVVANGVMYVFGGGLSDYKVVDELLALRLSDFRWFDLRGLVPSPPGRLYPVMMSFQSNIYVYGGANVVRRPSTDDDENNKVHILDIYRVIDPISMDSLHPRIWDPLRQAEPSLADASSAGAKGQTELQRPKMSVRLRLSSKDIHSVEIPNPNNPVTSGGYCDLFVGKHVPSRMQLALKRPRIKTDDPDDAQDAFRRFRREAMVWSAFDHASILPFFGMIETPDRLYLVSPWMERGSLSKFTKGRQRYLKNAASLKSSDPTHAYYAWFNEIRALHEIASGIAYLHSCDFVHGDLKCDNVLLAEDGHALLCDFGLTKTLDATAGATSTAMKGVGSLRWQSPELFDNHSKTSRSDAYAFAMIIVEVLTGDYPFPNLSDVAFFKAVLGRDERPAPTPTSRLDVDFKPLWLIASRCWQTLPQDRPRMDEIVHNLEKLFA